MRRCFSPDLDPLVVLDCLFHLSSQVVQESVHVRFRLQVAGLRQRGGLDHAAVLDLGFVGIFPGFGRLLGEERFDLLHRLVLQPNGFRLRLGEVGDIQSCISLRRFSSGDHCSRVVA